MSSNELNSFVNLGVPENASNSSSTKSVSGKILIGVTGGVAVGLSILCYPFVAPALRKHCLPFVPATAKQIENVLSAISKQHSDHGAKLLDIGSGDGRIVIAAARSHQIVAHGVELNPWLVHYSRLAALRGGVFGRTKFFRKDLWKYDISGYDNIVIFGVEQMMAELEEKIRNEAQPNATIIACRFPFPTLHPVKTVDDGIDSVWVYSNNK